MADQAAPITSAPSVPHIQSPKPVSVRADGATLIGLALAFGGVIGGLILEGGKLKDISQLTAAFIVLGGTCGAVLISTPATILSGAIRRLAHVFTDASRAPDAIIDQLIGFAKAARRNGIVSLEDEALKVADPFLRKALNLAVDGTDLQEIRAMMKLDIDVAENRAFAEARVLESAAGYSPTIGIIGAVMGLIQVMKNLANIDEVGHGIAVAFVATVYGVGLANLLLLPAATKMKARIEADTMLNELKLEGVVAIVEGLNPKLIRSKLESYVQANRKPVDRNASTDRQAVR
jgi:chemotaxis protein MotA